MALRIRYNYKSGSELVYCIERLSDKAYYNFQNNSFQKVVAGNFTGVLTENQVNLLKGIFSGGIDNTPVDIFPNGNYAVYIINSKTKKVIDALQCSMIDGDDGNLFAKSVSPVRPSAVVTNPKVDFTEVLTRLDLIDKMLVELKPKPNPVKPNPPSEYKPESFTIIINSSNKT